MKPRPLSPLATSKGTGKGKLPVNDNKPVDSTHQTYSGNDEDPLEVSHGSGQVSASRSSAAISSSSAASSSRRPTTMEKNQSWQDLLKEKAKQQACEALKNIGYDTRKMDDPVVIGQRQMSYAEQFTQDENIRNKVLCEEGERWQDWPLTAEGQQIPLSAVERIHQRELRASQHIAKIEAQADAQAETQDEAKVDSEMPDTSRQDDTEYKPSEPSQPGWDFKTQFKNAVNAVGLQESVQERLLNASEAVKTMPNQALTSTGPDIGSTQKGEARKWICKTDESGTRLEEEEEEDVEEEETDETAE